MRYILFSLLFLSLAPCHGQGSDSAIIDNGLYWSSGEVSGYISSYDVDDGWFVLYDSDSSYASGRFYLALVDAHEYGSAYAEYLRSDGEYMCRIDTGWNVSPEVLFSRLRTIGMDTGVGLFECMELRGDEVYITLSRGWEFGSAAESFQHAFLLTVLGWRRGLLNR